MCVGIVLPTRKQCSSALISEHFPFFFSCTLFFSFRCKHMTTTNRPSAYFQQFCLLFISFEPSIFLWQMPFSMYIYIIFFF